MRIVRENDKKKIFGDKETLNGRISENSVLYLMA